MNDSQPAAAPLSEETIDRVADLCGIGASYFDTHGTHQRVSTRTKARLLAALGWPVDSEAGLQAALAARLEAEQRRVLPPVLVVEQGQPVSIALPLPRGPGCGERRFVLQLETGEIHRGAIDRLEPVSDQPVSDHAAAAGGLQRGRFELQLSPPLGYHRLRVEAGRPGEPAAETTLIVVPHACYRPPVIDGGGRVWGPAVQLYALRSQRNWGIGDISDLAQLVEICRRQGAAVIGLNPLHALFPSNPLHCSPYSPSNRGLLNAIYIDVDRAVELAGCAAARDAIDQPGFQARLEALRGAELIAHDEVMGAKRSVLELLHRHFCERDLARPTPAARRYLDFVELGGELLRHHALFDALQEHFVAAAPGSGWYWPSWPAPYHDPTSPEVAAFAAAHADRVDFYQYLQWLVDEQLAEVGQRARQLGIGLYTDLAVSEEPSGAAVWADRQSYVTDVSLGAPPDAFAPQGQSWGVVPWHPERLREAAFRPFIEVLRRNMQHAGALRLDHAMGLLRLFWVPRDGGPGEGAYVGYPFDELLGIVALESHRNRCLVIGETLGTVPDGLRERLAERGFFSYRVLIFERGHDNEFCRPVEYPERAAVVVTTHDLPTLSGFWSGRDLQLRSSLGLLAEQQRDHQLAERGRDRSRLLRALEREGLLPAGAPIDGGDSVPMTPELCRAVHAFVGRTPSRVMLLQLEDLLGQTEQPNLPGTVGDQHPNWRQKLPLDLEQLEGDARVRAVVQALQLERP